MNGFKILTAWFGHGAPDIRALLQRVADSDNDFAPEFRAIVAKLDAAGTPDNLANVAGFLKEELGNISGGHFDGRRHSSDLV